MRDRVDRLGVAEPEIRKQGDDQIVDRSSRASTTRAAAEIIGKTAQLELFDLEANLVPPSIDAQGVPIATDSLYDLLAGQQALVERRRRRTWYLFDDEARSCVAGPVDARGELLSARSRAGEAASCRRAGKSSACRPNTVVVTCGDRRGRLPGRRRSRTRRSDYYYLFRYDAEQPRSRSRDDGRRSQARRARGRTSTRRRGEPIVLMQFTDKGADKFGDITRELAQRGRLLFNTLGGGQGDSDCSSTSRSCSTARSSRGRRSTSSEYPNGITRHERRADHRHRRHRRGEGPRARPPDRRAARRRSRRSSRPRSRPRSARTRSSEAKQAALAGLARRRALPAHLLPLPRRRRRHRPRHLRRASSTPRSCSSTSR